MSLKEEVVIGRDWADCGSGVTEQQDANSLLKGVGLRGGQVDRQLIAVYRDVLEEDCVMRRV